MIVLTKYLSEVLILKIYFYGNSTIEPTAVAEALQAFYRSLERSNGMKLYPGVPVIYLSVKDADGDLVFLSDSEDLVFLSDSEGSDRELSWEVRTSPRVVEKEENNLVYKNEETGIYIYQHYEQKSKQR